MIHLKTWHLQSEKCPNVNLHTSKIGRLLHFQFVSETVGVMVTSNHITEPHAKFIELM